MNPQEILSLLTARVQRFHLAPGGVPALTAEDVAHALGMIHNDLARVYARVKYSGQYEYAEGLALGLRRHILVKKTDDSWRIPRPDFVLDMSFMMLAEAIDPHTCRWCWGRAEVKPETGPVIVCSACDGSGRRKIKERDRARVMGIAESSWSDPWGKRYKDIQSDTVDKWEAIFVGAIKKRLA
jgi:hypothetical protein